MKKIIGIDIDGVLNNYPNTWVSYLNTTLGTDFRTLYEAKDTLPYSKYKKLKSGYRDNGFSEKLEPKEGAVEFLQSLKSMGYYIIIITSRPIDEHNSLLQQTTEWLKSKNLYYDFLYFSHSKHLDIIRKFKRIEFLVEDNLKFANDVSDHGYPTYLINNRYNQGDADEMVHRVSGLTEIIEDVKLKYNKDVKENG